MRTLDVSVLSAIGCKHSSDAPAAHQDHAVSLAMSDPFYRTRHWLKLRAARLRIDGDRCVVPGCGQPAKYVDHVVPRRDGGADALPNLRSLCAYHDNAIRQDRHGKRRMSGKLYVRECNADGSPRDPNHPWFRR
jgi:5-methylcytosine-specific restriction endonuclease McrA